MIIKADTADPGTKFHFFFNGYVAVDILNLRATISENVDAAGWIGVNMAFFFLKNSLSPLAFPRSGAAENEEFW